MKGGLETQLGEAAWHLSLSVEVAKGTTADPDSVLSEVEFVSASLSDTEAVSVSLTELSPGPENQTLDPQGFQILFFIKDILLYVRS